MYVWYVWCVSTVMYFAYYVIIIVFLFFFFKQKTAYEMRISDWSSDVCSSDLNSHGVANQGTARFRGPGPRRSRCGRLRAQDIEPGRYQRPQRQEIGRASCRERVCQYV